MGRTTYYANQGPFFAVSLHSLRWDEGHLINWNLLDESYQEDAQVVTLNATLNANDTSMTTLALPVAIPVGTNLYFSGTKKFVRVTAAAAKGATSVTIEAAPTAASSGDKAYWSPSRPGKIVKAGTFMTLEGGYMIPRALATAKTLAATTNVTNANPIAVNNFTSHGFSTGDFVRSSGVTTNLGANGLFILDVTDANTLAFRDSFGTGASGGTLSVVRAARGLLGSDAYENDRSASQSGRGLIVAGDVYRNLLPEYAASAFATYEGELQSAKRGSPFLFRTYVDNRS